MKIHFFERKLISNRISIEKVFSIVKTELIRQNYTVKSFENPYPLYQMIKSMWYFRKNQGSVNHITGDIHWAALLLDKNRTVLTIHDNVGVRNYQSKLKRKLYLLLWLYLPLKKLKYITVISQKTKDELTEFYPSAEHKIRVIHNPLTNKVFYRKAVIKRSQDFKLLIVGTRENKNLERILDAVTDFDGEIIIVGELNEVQMEKVRVSKAKISNEKFVTDNDLIQYYKDCDALCFPSLYEGFGMPIIEAQSNGCAVITSDLEPMRSIAGGSAVLVDPYSTEDIRDKILYLQSNFDKRSELVIKGYENIENFLPERITKEYLNLYKEISDGESTAS